MPRRLTAAELAKIEADLFEKHLPKTPPADVVERRLERELDRYYRDHPSPAGFPRGYYPTGSLTAAQMRTRCCF